MVGETSKEARAAVARKLLRIEDKEKWVNGEGYRTEVSMTGTMTLKIEDFGGGENEKVQGRCVWARVVAQKKKSEA